MWTFNVRAGELLHDDEHVGYGYSGYGDGKNNPALAHVHNVGPIPCGRWLIGPVHDTATHGPCVMRLAPCANTETNGRDGFLIHGDSISAPGMASHGCIILSRAIREQIAQSGDTELEVL